ncbi:MAG: radical SAM protein [Paludibacteraceae bacterium]|nr:radical SAM protein [Paludibacteraceae bacterium]
MKIQSLSICVPLPEGVNRCTNACRFCVSKMHREEYPSLHSGTPFQDEKYKDEFRKRLEFSRDNGCNTVMITGENEPQQNMPFIDMFSQINKKLPSSFKWIEMQTTGAGLDRNHLLFLQDYGVVTISLSLSNLYSEQNAEINCTPKHLKVNIEDLISEIRSLNFNLRLSLNMNQTILKDFQEDHQIMFERINFLQPDQVTFRKLYARPGTQQAKWVEKEATKESELKRLEDFIKGSGRLINILEYGQLQYSLDGISYVVDNDCMAKDQKSGVYKYLILRPNMKLYSQWDIPSSLVF